MTDYNEYINALRKCAKEHENDKQFTGHIIVSDLCKDTANLLEDLEQEPFINKPCVSEKICEHDKNVALNNIKKEIREWYWQSDKQKLAEDPCVVDAMIDLFVRTINKYIQESENNE